jgi:hypothetical protein
MVGLFGWLAAGLLWFDLCFFCLDFGLGSGSGLV